MRGSRIPHPRGGRLVKVWRWAVDAVGREAAMVLGELDWRDALQEEPGQPVATRATLVAALEGFASRNKVDEALAVLVGLGWVVRHERTTLGEKNLRTWHEFSLHADAIADFLAAPEAPASPNGDAGFPRMGTDFGPHSGSPTLGKPTQPPTTSVFVVGAVSRFNQELQVAAENAQLSSAAAQTLADALAGALRLPDSDKRRPRNVRKWLEGTAQAIAANEFVEGEAFLVGRELRRASVAADPTLVAADEAEKQQTLAASAAAVQAQAAAKFAHLHK